MKIQTFLILLVIVGLNSCQSNSIEVIFESNEKDIATQLNEPKIYMLKKQTTNSDFNYTKLDDIDGIKIDTLNVRNLMPVFEPVNGHYNYYQFIATFKGESYNFGEAPVIKDFHNILIIKTDNDLKILDAYRYTLEWAELPLQYNVFKGSAKNIKLKDSLDISNLKFLRTYNWSENNKELIENGIIRLK